MSLTVRAGHIHSIGNGPSYFSDRFQLGGPLNIRLFKTKSIGPRDGCVCTSILEEVATSTNVLVSGFVGW